MTTHPDLQDLLASLSGSLRARISRYDHRRNNLLVGEAETTPTRAGGSLVLGGSVWKLRLLAEPLEGPDGGFECGVRFECVGGAVEQAALSVVFWFSEWSQANHVLLPGAVYAGNRFPSRRLRYSPKLYEVQDIGPDKPIIISDVPRLGLPGEVSRLQELSSSLSTPALGFHDPDRKLAFWLLASQGGPLGAHGFSVEESSDGTQAWLSLSAPVVRELRSYRICDAQRPSIDRPVDFHEGDWLELRFRVHVVAAPELQGLYDSFARLRKSLVSSPPAPRRLPYSACFALQEQKFNSLNFVPEHGYYSVGLRENFLQDWQIGWTGGMITTHPLLFSGGEETVARVLRNFDWLFPNGICPCGLFWDSGRGGTEWIGGDIRKPHTGNWHLIRKSGDGVFYILKQFDLMEKRGIPIKPAWNEGLLRVCGALVGLWRKHGQFGQFVDSLTGDVVVGGSTGGAIIPAALVLAWQRYRKPEFLSVAEAAGEKYYQEYTRRGLACGGPGDALQNLDSESCYALLEAYVSLHEAGLGSCWLERAAEQARQFATWVVSYDFPFPPSSLFGRAGIRTTGAVYANTQNKHAAPGICTYSGLALLRLFRATGDLFALDLLTDIAGNIPQYLPHPAKPLGEVPPGRVCERVNMTDWEGPEKVGEIATPGTWAETSLLLTTIEIPGVYVQPDTGLVRCFDAVSATSRREGNVLVVELTNTSGVEARVRVLAESSTEAANSFLGENRLLACPQLHLRPGAKELLRFALG